MKFTIISQTKTGERKQAVIDAPDKFAGALHGVGDGGVSPSSNALGNVRAVGLASGVVALTSSGTSTKDTTCFTNIQ